jgi:HPt (histidine-containing phosphotransfer) domain-containing protein
MLLEEAPRWLEDLSASQAQGDTALFTRTAHTLKGSVDHWGARRAFELAKDLERRGRSGDISGVSRIVDELSAEYALFLDDLGRFRTGRAP